MVQPEILLLVRFQTALTREELLAMAQDRAPQFRALDGLEQKYYVFDPETGEYGGLYLWRDMAALDEYRRSELRSTIAEAYQTTSPPRVELLQVLMPLRDAP